MKTLATLFRSNVREYGMLIALIAIMIFSSIKRTAFDAPRKYHQPGTAEQLHHCHGAGHVVDYRCRLDRPLGWVCCRLRRRNCCSVDGQIRRPLGPDHVDQPVIGALVGAWQGYWVAYVKIPAFIVTLAGMLIFRGLTLLMLQGEAVGPFPTPFQKLSNGFIPDFFNVEGFHLTTI
jgi:putative multiple sugar transport system permease protein